MRKILFITAAAVCTSFIASAQLQKGAVQLGGGISIGESSNNVPPNNNSWSVFLSPSVGITVKDLLVVGVRGLYGNNFSKQNNETRVKNNVYGGGIFVRKYLPLGKNFFLSGDAGADFSQGVYEQRYPLSWNQLKTKSYSLSFFPGITYAVNKRFLLELNLNNLINMSYTQQLYRSNSGTYTEHKTNNLNFNLNGSSTGNLSVGFRVVL